ncbi:MAG: tRNA (adenosine(37)-N6)-threonylcarbamoyltransferase complex ATPase subunit type 1 TsaE [Alphaproteobacteria bacterium]|jgi:tRNA threonylcarbamoyl adenosine modification protein YjeE|nr:tRNA (adenosine(37)-N6)-threonylcarbamoyltransferase complex ATPase subunit type 1 TsaE [Alphaproteobacteria bacterium]
MEITCSLNSIQDTKKIAIILSKYLQNIIILLSGDIGSGKTTFASFFINAVLEKEQNITSPTFPIIQSYDTTIGLIYHLDLYRVESPHELHNLGIDEILLHTCLIEWAERLETYTPKHFVRISLFNETGKRKMVISFSKKYENIYKKVQQELLNHDL